MQHGGGIVGTVARRIGPVELVVPQLPPVDRGEHAVAARREAEIEVRQPLPMRAQEIGAAEQEGEVAAHPPAPEHRDAERLAHGGAATIAAHQVVGLHLLGRAGLVLQRR